MGDLTIALEVPEHFVLAETFISTTRTTNNVLKTLNREYFSGALDLYLVVEAPEAGSLRAVLRVVVKGVRLTFWGTATAYAAFWSFVQFMETDIAKQITQDETGKLPAQIASEKFQELKAKMGEIRSEEDLTDEDKAQVADFCEQLSSALAATTAGTMSALPEKIDRTELSLDAKYQIKRAQSELYTALLDEKQVSAVCFETKNGIFPPILRNEFASHAARPEKPKEEPEEKWVVQEMPLNIVALAFKKVNSRNGRWIGLSPNKKELEFTIEDQGFWRMVHSRDARFAEGTVLKVQLASRYENDRLRERKVVKVLEFEGKEIAKALSNDALDALLGEWSHYMPKDPAQKDMEF
ncbi:hypothetical protein [Celeribacter baekdonensis]|uniref:hypothetical protein n=1 Tax=Celeribacter baekdonensis TaxID=875171 RepID=UPI003A928713